jgi:hypothetical protein
MKGTLLAITLALATLVLGPGEAAAQSSFDLLGWLEGDWVRQTRSGEATESWRRVSEDTLEGVGSIAFGGSTTVTEYLRLERFGEEVFFVAKPGHNPMPTPFKLTECSEERAAFENPDHDFPQRIIYMRDGDDGLHVRIDGAMDGQPRAVDFHFTRKR